MYYVTWLIKFQIKEAWCSISLFFIMQIFLSTEHSLTQDETMQVRVQGFCPYKTSTAFLVPLTTQFSQTLIMAMKSKSLDLKRKL